MRKGGDHGEKMVFEAYSRQCNPYIAKINSFEVKGFYIQKHKVTFKWFQFHERRIGSFLYKFRLNITTISMSNNESNICCISTLKNMRLNLVYISFEWIQLFFHVYNEEIECLAFFKFIIFICFDQNK
jgi:hypothetical protein